MPTPCPLQPAPWLVADEPAWRRPSILESAARPAPPIVASRWTDLGNRTSEAMAVVRADFHMIGIALRSTDLALSAGGRTIHDGRVASGMLQVSGPGDSLRGLFRAGCDFLHLHVANDFLAECHAATTGCVRLGCIALADSRFALDPTIEQLGRALLAADTLDPGYGRLYADGLGQAIVARLVGRDARCGRPPRAKVAALAKWRLDRVTDHVEAHLGEPISLADLAGAAGVSRMHFAAQFRAATGLRPHEYLLRRRIARAQDLLATSEMAAVEVALGVGFQTQAHFSTVFKRFVGQTPGRWRRDAGGPRPAPPGPARFYDAGDPSSPSNVLAASRSSVSNPSVNRS